MKTTHHRTNALYKDHEIIGTKNPATTNYYDTSRQVDRNNVNYFFNKSIKNLKTKQATTFSINNKLATQFHSYQIIQKNKASKSRKEEFMIKQDICYQISLFLLIKLANQL